MNNYKITIGIMTFLYALFIFSFPPSYYNDDALFLARGIDNFSIIDFSPHFPGYPFVIIAGKFINIFISDSKYSLFILTSLSAILLPFIIFLYVKKLSDEKVALIAFFLSLSSPYLVNLSLSMLSDSVGLFFLFLGLYLLEVNKSKTSGIVFSIALFSRPSYLIFYVVGLIYLFIVKKSNLKQLLIWFFITTLIFVFYIFFTNGILYIYEAERFILGHFNLWGTGQNSQLSWYENIFSFANIPFIVLFYSFFKYQKSFTFLYVLFIFYLSWILLAQNPDNLRHLIPLVFITIIFISQSIKNSYSLVVLILFFNLYNIVIYDEEISPIEQIINKIDEKNRLIISNRSIEILREKYNNRVVDHYYINNANYLKQNNKIYLITTEIPLNTNKNIFQGRFIGEKTFYLSKN
ncbi:glycosyltransferase family 39 protein [Arcobacter sp. LA11]|uniref:glycosyltransferase family 39 protein n=1 Tax=Arcobacter sp. LA11 TaxID=1898176 RepID=UPI000933DDE9|nr:glycosyltransferase family 39 protein [Arcobacter sp. LA11]